MNAPVNAAGAAPSAAAAIPVGFDELASSRITLVDVYFGGRKVIETLALTQPGSLKLRSPGDVLAKLPQVIVTPELSSALAGELPTNSGSVCSATNAGACGVLEPPLLGIIYDEDHFRLDLFVNPKFLRMPAAPQGYLPTPDAPLSLTDAVGVDASGTIGGSSVYNLQNRTVIATRNVRIRANTSVASDLGFIVDDLVGEVDRKELRYSAGLFWAPGDEFTGQRRIIGAGVTTQFDTAADPDMLRGTPLILFLAQPARVDLVVDGRLVSSGSYPAGNIDVDTSALAEGSYSVLLRIRESNGSVREERRFFVKNAKVPPLHRPMFYGYAGLLANTRVHQPISLSRTLYFEAGTAWRVANSLAFDVAAVGTQHKAIVEAGTWLIGEPLRLRAAALVSTSGDRGALVQVSTTVHGLLNLNLDLRRIWSQDGNPLIPLAFYASSFETPIATEAQFGNGSYTQATGSVALQLGKGSVSIVGSYRKDRHLRSDYTIGPSVSWPVLTRNQVQIVLEASAQRTRTTTAAFAGLRVLFNRGPLSMLATIGEGFQADDAGQPSVSRVVGSYSAQYSHETADQTLINADAGFDRTISSSTAHVGTTVNSQIGDFRADLLHDIEGGASTQYDFAFQSGLALGGHSAAWGARDLEQSAIVVSLSGDAADASFTVLVDEVPKGRVRVGGKLSLFVPGYRTYKIRLVPSAATSVDYDSAAREVTLYPGNVQSLAWSASSYFTVFGQAFSTKGSEIAYALVQTPKGIAQTDANGYFQVDVRRNDFLTITKGEGRPCQVQLHDVVVKDDFASIGKVVCQ